MVANNLASASTTLGDYATAETLYLWVLQSYEVIHGPDHLQMAGASNNLGYLYGELGRSAEARALFERALVIYQDQAPQHPDVGNVHANLGFLLQNEGDLVGAERHLRASLAVRQSALGPDHPEVAIARMNLAALLSSAGDFEGTLREFEAAKNSLERTLGPDHPLVASTLAGMGYVAMEMADYDRSRELLERAVVILESAYGPDHGELASLLNTLAQLELHLGRLGPAQVDIDRAVSIYEAVHGPEHPELGPLLTQQGATRAAAGDHLGARASYSRAIEVAEAAWGPGSPAVGHAWNAYGVLLLEEGDMATGMECLIRSRQILEEALGPGHADTTGVLNHLAYGLAEQGQYVEARRLYEEALAIAQRVYGPEHPEPAQVLHNLGILLHEQGDAVGARRHYEQSLAWKEAALGPVHPSVANTLDKLSELDGWEGDLESARSRIERSLAIRMEVLGASHPDVAHSHVRLAMLAHRAGDHETAAASYATAQGIWEAGGLGQTDSATRVRVMEAGLRFDQGDVAGSVALLEQALAETETRTAPGEPGRVWIERRLALAVAAQGDRDRARSLVSRSLEGSEAALGPVLVRASERARLAMIRSHRESLDVYLSLFDRPQDAGEAYRGVLRWKGVATRSLAGQQAASRASDDPELVAWKMELAQVRGELARRTWAGETTGLEELTLRKEVLQRDLAIRSDDVGRDLRVIEAEASDLCEALPEGGGLVDLLRYARTEAGNDRLETVPHYAAFVLLKGACDRVHRVELGPAAPLEEAIARHRGLLASGTLTRRIDKAGTAVRALAWAPLEPVLGPADPVLIVPDGALATVAFSALPDSGRYLLEERHIGYLEAAQDLLGNPSSDASQAEGALVVGGVRYEAATAVAAARLDPGDLGVTRAAACLADLAPLPATLPEAEGVAEVLGAGTVLLTGHQASEQRVAQEAQGKRVVHLATHGFFAGESCRSAMVAEGGGGDAVLGMNPMLLSGLALAGANDGGEGGGDGVWTAEEIAGLSLEGTELVVLSACDTALGTIEAGEGVLGLRRAFTLTGAGTMVMSLWPVDDRSTALLMQTLYGGLAEHSAPEALRLAQLALLAQNRTQEGEARPETWAAFIASGADW